ncbi:MAG: PEP-CTERM sorting domain-containing protein [Flavobacteriales bacterium]|nr:PEP-CTERM sorting domain-containing protein [Flavobacteriales bacterium]
MKCALLLASFVLSSWASSAFSSVITPAVTGADMAGIQVTATFDGGFTETLVWGVTGSDASVANSEGFSGGVTGAGWSLVQQGNTFGDVTPTGQLLGLWTLSNFSTSDLDLLTLTIDALAGGIVFDNVFGVEETVGSSVGRPFTPDQLGVTAVYGDIYSSPDLWGNLTLAFSDFDSGSTLRFFADTDAVVPVPGSLSLLVIGMLGLIVSRRHQQSEV